MGEYGEYLLKFSRKNAFPLKPTSGKYSTSFEKYSMTFGKYSWSISRNSLSIWKYLSEKVRK